MQGNLRKKALSRIKRMANRKVYKNLIDYDYLNKLSTSEIEFLATFTEEKYGAANHSHNPQILTSDEIRAGWSETFRNLRNQKLTDEKFIDVELIEFDELNPEELVIWREQHSIRLLKD